MYCISTQVFKALSIHFHGKNTTVNTFWVFGGVLQLFRMKLQL